MEGEIGATAWNLILKLAVSKEYLEEVKKIFEKELKGWEELFKSSKQGESIYRLYLIKSIIADSSDKELAELREEPSAEERTALRLSILNSKAIQYAVKYIRNLEGYVLQESVIEFIRMTLNIIIPYLVESMRGNKKLPDEFQLYEYRLPKEDDKPIIRKQKVPVSKTYIKQI